MSRQRVTADDPCTEPGCTNTRHVERDGHVRAKCTAHWRAYLRAKNTKHWAKKKGQQPPPPPVQADLRPRVNGRAQPPTVEINEAARTVRQIVGNVIVSQCELPERGLHRHTLELLKARGWRVRYVGEKRKTA